MGWRAGTSAVPWSRVPAWSWWPREGVQTVVNEWISSIPDDPGWCRTWSRVCSSSDRHSIPASIEQWLRSHAGTSIQVGVEPQTSNPIDPPLALGAGWAPRVGVPVLGAPSPEGVPELDGDDAHLFGVTVASHCRPRLPAEGAAGPEGKDSEELQEGRSGSGGLHITGWDAPNWGSSDARWMLQQRQGPRIPSF